MAMHAAYSSEPESGSGERSAAAVYWQQHTCSSVYEAHAIACTRSAKLSVRPSP